MTRPKTFTPKWIVSQLDLDVIGQHKAKKILATEAYKRRISGFTRKENILLSGDTGSGKSLLATTLAKVVRAPFIDIDITTYSETGFVGNKVDQIANLIAQEVADQIGSKHDIAYSLDIENAVRKFAIHFFDGASEAQFDALCGLLATGQLDEFSVPIDPEFRKRVKDNGYKIAGKKLKIAFAKTMFADPVDMNGNFMGDAIRERAKEAIVLVDEIDKLCEDDSGRGHSVSRTGVQRSLLAFIQGKKYAVEMREGKEKRTLMIDTTPILFIGAGAFQMEGTSRANLLPELRGRFTKYASVDRLGAKEYRRIISEPSGSPLRGYTDMLSNINIDLKVDDSALDLVAEWVIKLNEKDYVGARRVNGVFSTIMDTILYDIEKYGSKIELDESLIKKVISLDELADPENEDIDDFSA